MGNDLSPLLTALIRSKTGPNKFTCIPSWNSHKNPTGKELSSGKYKETQALGFNTLLSFHSRKGELGSKPTSSGLQIPGCTPAVFARPPPHSSSPTPIFAHLGPKCHNQEIEMLAKSRHSEQSLAWPLPCEGLPSVKPGSHSPGHRWVPSESSACGFHRAGGGSYCQTGGTPRFMGNGRGMSGESLCIGKAAPGRLRGREVPPR